MKEQERLYSELCGVLDSYESSSDDDSLPLYEMLCEIQSSWNNITGGSDVTEHC